MAVCRYDRAARLTTTKAAFLAHVLFWSRVAVNSRKDDSGKDCQAMNASLVRYPKAAHAANAARAVSWFAVVPSWRLGISSAWADFVFLRQGSSFLALLCLISTGIDYS
ncbi:hypothetical protein BR93DRAFT_828900 [Coniochaeta sp. PMI_546]|nr:hypothetical protein BR93DRAFT_828900 [Coniochaeta sp. PMI_546]